MRSLSDVREELVGSLRRLKTTPIEERTPALREIAARVAESRSFFQTKDTGDPDWFGRTNAYRVWIRTVYDDAGFQRDEARSVQSSLRYHVGQAVRELADAEALEEAGIMPETPKERAREYQRTVRAVQNEIGSGLLSLSAVYVVLRRINAEAMAAELEERERDIAMVTLSDLIRRAREIRETLEDASPARVRPVLTPVRDDDPAHEPG